MGDIAKQSVLNAARIAKDVVSDFDSGFHYVAPDLAANLQKFLVQNNIWQAYPDIVPAKPSNSQNENSTTEENNQNNTSDNDKQNSNDNESVADDNNQQTEASNQDSSQNEANAQQDPTVPSGNAYSNVYDYAERTYISPLGGQAVARKEKDARDGHEAPLFVDFGTFGIVLSTPRDLGIFFEFEYPIRDGSELEIGEAIALSIPAGFNCMNGVWSFELDFSATSIQYLNTNVPDFSNMQPFDPNNPTNPATLYSASITFGDGVNSYTFSTSYPTGIQMSFLSQTIPSTFDPVNYSFTIFGGTIDVPIVVSGLPESFVPTSIETSVFVDFQTNTNPALASVPNLQMQIYNALGSTLGEDPIGPPLFGGPPFFQSVPFYNVSTNAEPIILNSTANGGSYEFSDSGAAITPDMSTLNTGGYVHNSFITNFAEMAQYVCQHPLPDPPFFPVGLDLDGDGIELVNPTLSPLLFDVDQDGKLESIGWVNRDDGMLIYDHNHDGLVTEVSEFQLTDYAPDALTDLQALAMAFDTNDDGVFDANDEAWQDFGVWQDKNLNGATDDGEFATLNQLGIASIGLSIEPLDELLNGNQVLGSSVVTFEDGSTTGAFDLGLAYVEPAENIHYVNYDALAVDSNIDLTPVAPEEVIVADTQTVTDAQNLTPDI